MNMHLLVKTALCAVFLVAPALVGAKPVAGQFGWPILRTDSGPSCDRAGVKIDQQHFDFFEEVGKYHSGEDWNGLCNGDTDLGYPLRAVADGVVSGINTATYNGGQGMKIFVRHRFPYFYEEDGLKNVYFAYLHLNSFSENIHVGRVVPKGLEIAQMGYTGTSGKFPYKAHLHIQALWDDGGGKDAVLENPYVEHLTPETIMEQCSPSLLLDDRARVDEYGDNQKGWYIFRSIDYAPWSTAYFQKGTEKKSIPKAIEAGWVYRHIPSYSVENGWEFFDDLEDSMCYKDGWYAFYAWQTGIKLMVPVPGNNQKYQRALYDCGKALHRWGDASHMYPDRFEERSGSTWHLSFFPFKTRTEKLGYVFHYTHQKYPLYRVTRIHDGSRWYGYEYINQNKLY